MISHHYVYSYPPLSKYLNFMPLTVRLQSGGRMTEIRILMSAPVFKARFANHVSHLHPCLSPCKSFSQDSVCRYSQGTLPLPFPHTLPFSWLIVCGGRLQCPAASAKTSCCSHTVKVLVAESPFSFVRSFSIPKPSDRIKPET